MSANENSGLSEVQATSYTKAGFYKKCSPDNVFIMLNAQTVDVVFPNWIAQSKMDSLGYYQPFNLNVPASIPRRENNVKYYQLDPPLSQFGLHSAKLMGKKLKADGADIRRIYCTPQLQSVQTATKIKKYFADCNIFVDQDLLASYIDPNALLSVAQLQNNGYPVNTKHKGDWVPPEKGEPLEKTFTMILQVFQKATDEHKSHNILFVVEAPVMKLLVDFLAGEISLERNCYLFRASMYAIEKKAKIIYQPAAILPFKWITSSDGSEYILKRDLSYLMSLTCEAHSTFIDEDVSRRTNRTNT
ncbi:histidine phosphatase superfamily (branch 1) domain-containing protein [Ditylenchus destructor]|uniref:Histidine phosphatase superfamily (Branch 1) domain-containing protein n=1 Tax=Ditylenchus destructor TaxID=166010 RepID=A0AAD4R7N7_9BILA|nr:histidine phosphatase superfamily (branch 1) domain-containing protein [Ditylenchus destructor]